MTDTRLGDIDGIEIILRVESVLRLQHIPINIAQADKYPAIR